MHRSVKYSVGERERHWISTSPFSGSRTTRGFSESPINQPSAKFAGKNWICALNEEGLEQEARLERCKEYLSLGICNHACCLKLWRVHNASGRNRKAFIVRSKEVCYPPSRQTHDRPPPQA